MIDIAGGVVCQFRVDGRPRTKGSLRGICTKGPAHKVHMVEQGEFSKPWKLKMAREIRREISNWVLDDMFRDGWVPCPLAVEVRAVFFFERTIGVNGLVWPSHDTPYPTDINLGDLDKLDRNLLDALTQSKLIGDDSQVVRIISEKRWADGALAEGVQVTVLVAPAGGPGDPL